MMHVISALVVLVLFTAGITTAQAQEERIPDWIKLVAEFWINGEISDQEYLQTIQWLVNSGLVVLDDPVKEHDVVDVDKDVPSIEAESEESAEKLPKHVPDNVRVNGQKPYVTLDKTAYRIGDTVNITGHVKWPSGDTLQVDAAGRTAYPEALLYSFTIGGDILVYCRADYPYEADKFSEFTELRESWQGMEYGKFYYTPIDPYTPTDDHQDPILCDGDMDGNIRFSFDLTDDFQPGTHTLSYSFDKIVDRCYYPIDPNVRDALRYFESMTGCYDILHFYEITFDVMP